MVEAQSVSSSNGAIFERSKTSSRKIEGRGPRKGPWLLRACARAIPLRKFGNFDLDVRVVQVESANADPSMNLEQSTKKRTANSNAIL
jgi:hypothetical protein